MIYIAVIALQITLVSLLENLKRIGQSSKFLTAQYRFVVFVANLLTLITLRHIRIQKLFKEFNNNRKSSGKVDKSIIKKKPLM